jgi:hypothetical protein
LNSYRATVVVLAELHCALLIFSGWVYFNM